MTDDPRITELIVSQKYVAENLARQEAAINRLIEHIDEVRGLKRQVDANTKSIDTLFRQREDDRKAADSRRWTLYVAMFGAVASFVTALYIATIGVGP